MYHNFGVYSFEEMMAEDLESQADNGDSSRALGKSPCSLEESRGIDHPQMFNDSGGVVTEKLEFPQYEVEKRRHVSSGDLQTPERQQSPQWYYTTSDYTEQQEQAASNQWNETDERQLQSMLPQWDDNPTGTEDMQQKRPSSQWNYTTESVEMEERAASRQWNNTETDEEEIQSLFPLWDNKIGTEDTLQHAASTQSNEAKGTDEEQIQYWVTPKCNNKKRTKERVETEEIQQLKMLPEWNEQYDSEEIQRQNWYNHWNEQHRESFQRNDLTADEETTLHMESSQRDDPTAGDEARQHLESSQRDYPTTGEETRQHMESSQRDNTSQTDDFVGLDDETFSFQRLFEQRAGSVPRRREGLPWRADINSREALQDSREDQSDESRLHELSQWREYTREDSRRRKDLRWLEKSRQQERARRQEDTGRVEDVCVLENWRSQQETYRREMESYGQTEVQIELIRVAFSQRLGSDDVEPELDE